MSPRRQGSKDEVRITRRLGPAVRRLRIECKMSLAQLARNVGITPEELVEYESGETELPSETIAAILKQLNDDL